MVNVTVLQKHPARTAGTCLNSPACGTILHGEREKKFLKSPQKVVNVGLNPQDSSQPSGV